MEKGGERYNEGERRGEVGESTFSFFSFRGIYTVPASIHKSWNFVCTYSEFVLFPFTQPAPKAAVGKACRKAGCDEVPHREAKSGGKDMRASIWVT